MNPAGVRIVISALDKTKGAFGSATRGISAVAGALTGLKAGLVAVAGAGGFAYMVKSSIDATDALAKTASKIGTTTEALSALRYAANLSGVETNTLDMAMQRFTRRLSEAVKGTGEAKGALQELELNARDLARLPLDQRMAVLADAFGNVSSETDKLRLAFKLFDSEGVALVNMLNNGSDGLQDMFDDAEALGLIMRSNAAKGVEQASDSLYRIGRVALGVRDTFVAAIAPAIKLISDRLVEFITKSAAAKGGFQELGRSMALAFLDAAESIGVGLLNIQQKITGWARTVSGTFNQIKRGIELRQVESDINRYNGLLRGLEEEIAKAADPNRQNDAFVRAAKLFGFEVTSVEQLVASYNELADKTRDLYAKRDALTSVQDENTQGVNEESGAIATLRAEMERLRGAIDSVFSAPIDTKPLEEAITVADRIKAAFKDSVDGVIGEIPTLEQSIDSLTRGAMNNFTQSFTDAITGAKKFSDAMRSMAKSVVDSLIKMLVQYYITKPLFDAITGFIGGGAPAANTAATINTGASFGGYAAMGGTVTAGKSYMVGEKGAEMFIPSATGTIIPNNKLGGGSGVTVNQVINVTTGVQQTVRAEIANLMPQISNAAKSAVAEARMRGGSYSKALVGA